MLAGNGLTRGGSTLNAAEEFYSIEVQTIEGVSLPLAALKGKALLIVNVASHCGFTPQYQGLESLHQKYKGQGLEVMGFPCNQFGAQEPGDEAEIKKFCSLTYDVTFPMFAKVEVNGDAAHPLFKLLKSAEKGVFGTEAIKWNFTKFLVSPAGEVLARYAPTTPPQSLEGDIKLALGVSTAL